jgi:enoyl-CoA hydratase
MSERLLTRIEDGLCTLTLNRPEKRNALDSTTFDELDEAISTIETDDGIGCLVLRGAGKAFSAGADLGMVGGPKDARPANFKEKVVERLATLAKPTVAAIHGTCFTGGLELALACDFLIADGSAKFADTHGTWGFVGSWGITQRLPRRIGTAQAKRMMMTSRVIDAREALAIGLIDLLAPEGGLDAAIAEFTAPILANSWHTNSGVKRILVATEGMPIAQALTYEHFNHPGMAPDVQERLARFQQRK